jgi:hypothetical protein
MSYNVNIKGSAYQVNLNCSLIVAKNRTHFEISLSGNVWKYLEMVQHDTEKQKIALLHF